MVIDCTRHTMKRFFALILMIFGYHTANAETFTAKCKHVFDGDSFSAIREGETDETEIRLYGIDAPEKGQDYAKQSREKLIKLIRNKQVRIEVQDTDSYGRSVGKVYVGKTYVNLEMVKSGLAWYYEHHAKGAKDLQKAEAKARKSKKGLWQDAAPVNPKDWRRDHQTAHEEKKGTPIVQATVGNYHGTCTEVKDGEEFYLKTSDGKQLHVYLNGTDAPEQEQDPATCRAAEEKLLALILGKELTVNVTEAKNNRHYAAVYEGDTYINAEMVRCGLSWYSSLHAPNDTALKAADQEARAAKVGIWATPNPEAPWKWRKRHPHELNQ